MEVKFASQLGSVDSNNVFVSYFFFLDKPVALVNFSIGANKSCELVLNLRKVNLVRLLVLGFILLEYLLVKYSGSEPLSVQDFYFFFIN